MCKSQCAKIVVWLLQYVYMEHQGRINMHGGRGSKIVPTGFALTLGILYYVYKPMHVKIRGT